MNQILNGRYRIDGRVGDGGMAVVYRGWDMVLNRVVAVKVLREQYAVNTQFLRRFQREAQSAAGLAHPNIVNVYDVGRDGETWYIVMELIDGTDLAALIRQRAPYTVVATTDIMAQVMSALDYAHERGIVHRDVKPHNILIDSRGTAKVVDFGIAKGVNDITMTDAGTALGTAGYISPEQATGAPITATSDLYSAGVVLYEMLTGRLPFLGDTAVSVAMQHVRSAPPPPTQFNADIPPAVEHVVLRAMEKSPERRYSSGAELVAALRDAVANPTSISPPPSIAAVGGAGGGATAVLTPETQALPQEAVPPRPPSMNGAGRIIPPPPLPPRRQSSGPGAGVWVIGLFLLAGLIAAAYFGYQLVNVTGANKGPNVQATSYATTNLTTTLTQTASRPTASTVRPSATPIPDDTTIAPNFSGLPQDQLQVNAMRNGVNVGTLDRRISNDVPFGSVIEQSPKPGDSVKKGAKINFVISAGPEKTDLTKLQKDGKPYDVKGQTYEEVAQLLRNDGLQPLPAINEPSADVEAGKVTRIVPAQGMSGMSSVVTNGTPINIYVSAGRPTATAVPATATVAPPTATTAPRPTATPAATATVAAATPTTEPTKPMMSAMPVLPNVYAKSPNEAQQILKDAGFSNVKAVTGDSSGVAIAVPKGTVFAIVDGKGNPMYVGQSYPKDTQVFVRYQEA